MFDWLIVSVGLYIFKRDERPALILIERTRYIHGGGTGFG